MHLLTNFKKRKRPLKSLKQLLYKPRTNSHSLIFNDADADADADAEIDAGLGYSSSSEEADEAGCNEAGSVESSDDDSGSGPGCIEEADEAGCNEAGSDVSGLDIIKKEYCDYLGSTLGGTFSLDSINTKSNRISKLLNWCIVINNGNNNIYNKIKCLFTDQGLLIGKYLDHNTKVLHHTPATSLIWIDDIKSFLDYISTRVKGDPLLIMEDDLRIVKTLLTKLSKAYRKLVRKQRSFKTLKSHINQRKIPIGGLPILRTTVLNQVAKVKAKLNLYYIYIHYLYYIYII